MKEPILQTQIKVPENSRLVGKTNEDIQKEFSIEIHHKHNPHPSKKAVKCNKKDHLESDKFVSISGLRGDIKKFTNVLLENY